MDIFLRNYSQSTHYKATHPISFVENNQTKTKYFKNIDVEISN